MHISAAIQLCLWAMVYLPFTVYLVHILWKHRRNPYFLKRDPKLLFAVLLFTFLIYTNTVLLWGGHHRQLCVLPVCKTVALQILEILTSCVLHGLCLTFTVRVWLLYFNLRWSQEIKRSEWLREINRTATQNNFFLKFKSTLIGSFEKMKWHLLIFYFVLISIFSVIAFYDISLFEELNCASLFFVFVFQLIILYRTPKNDVFCIRKEMAICSVIWFAIGAYHGVTIPLKLHDKYIFVAMLTPYISFICSSLVNGAAILYPLYHLQDMKITEGLRLSIAGKGPLLWTEYVSQSRENFDNFMSHLVREYSVENLLFILEVMQLKAKHFDDAALDNAISDNNTNVGYYLHLPSDTKSSIIYGKETIHPLQQILSLYNKYITRSAPFQVNISWQASMQIEGIINSVIMNKNNFTFNPLIFDNSVEEIVGLVDNSWCRFKLKTISKTTAKFTDTLSISDKYSSNTSNKETTTPPSCPSTVDHSIEIELR